MVQDHPCRTDGEGIDEDQFENAMSFAFRALAESREDVQFRRHCIQQSGTRLHSRERCRAARNQSDQRIPVDRTCHGLQFLCETDAMYRSRYNASGWP